MRHRHHYPLVQLSPSNLLQFLKQYTMNQRSHTYINPYENFKDWNCYLGAVKETSQSTITYNESEVTKFELQMLIDTLVCCDSCVQVSPCQVQWTCPVFRDAFKIEYRALWRWTHGVFVALVQILTETLLPLFVVVLRHLRFFRLAWGNVFT